MSFVMTVAEREAFLAGVHIGVLAVERDGPVVDAGGPPTRDQALRITRRYLPEDDAVAYVDGSLGDRSLLIRMCPEKWLSNDQSK